MFSLNNRGERCVKVLATVSTYKLSDYVQKNSDCVSMAVLNVNKSNVQVLKRYCTGSWGLLVDQVKVGPWFEACSCVLNDIFVPMCLFPPIFNLLKS